MSNKELKGWLQVGLVGQVGLLPASGAFLRKPRLAALLSHAGYWEAHLLLHAAVPRLLAL